MKQIITTLSQKCINRRMKNKGFSGRKSSMTSFARIYTKDGLAIMYVFQRLINRSKMSKYA